MGASRGGAPGRGPPNLLPDDRESGSAPPPLHVEAEGDARQAPAAEPSRKSGLSAFRKAGVEGTRASLISGLKARGALCARSEAPCVKSACVTVRRAAILLAY